MYFTTILDCNFEPEKLIYSPINQSLYHLAQYLSKFISDRERATKFLSKNITCLVNEMMLSLHTRTGIFASTWRMLILRQPLYVAFILTIVDGVCISRFHFC